jgi:phosphatidate cytidylyltransferase
MSNFWQRLLTGIVFVAVIVGATLFSPNTFLALLMLIACGGLYEYYRIVYKAILKPVHYLYIVFGIALVASKHWLSVQAIPYLLVIVFALSAISVLLSKDRSWKHIGYLFSGILYIPMPLALFYSAVFRGFENLPQEYYPYLALNLFILIWSSDTFAYLSGRAFGKHKLFESVSPKKTWEGLIGGAILTIAFSLLLSYLWDIPYQVNIAVALCTVVFGVLGDLVESMLKREFDIKDSGKILPGHGGILDRFDALFISLPFTSFCYYLML